MEEKLWFHLKFQSVINLFAAAIMSAFPPLYGAECLILKTLTRNILLLSPFLLSYFRSLPLCHDVSNHKVFHNIRIKTQNSLLFLLSSNGKIISHLYQTISFPCYLLCQWLIVRKRDTTVLFLIISLFYLGKLQLVTWANSITVALHRSWLRCGCFREALAWTVWFRNFWKKHKVLSFWNYITLLEDSLSESKITFLGA